MPEPFKNKFNANLVRALADAIAANYNGFSHAEFVEDCLNNIDVLELKQRASQIQSALKSHLPTSVQATFELLQKVIAPASETEEINFELGDDGLRGWIMMPIADFAAQISVNEDFHAGLAMQRELTKRFSSEFSIRVFLQARQEETLAVMSQWTQDSNVHVRRLASEGCRPRLPWGMQLKSLVKDPAPLFPILAQLLSDPSEYVRRSVANNLNDISKDHPEYLLDFVEKHYNPDEPQLVRLFKHACRGLIKQGNKRALKLFGVVEFKGEIVDFSVDAPQVLFGDSLNMCLILQTDTEQKLIVDYVVYHKKANGKLAPKVFKWSSCNIKSDKTLTLTKSHAFKEITTRKYYDGEHKIAVVINGEEYPALTFFLHM